MTGYAALSGTQIDADSPLIEDTFTKLRDNPLAMFEGAAGSPKFTTNNRQSVTLDVEGVV